MNFKSRVLGDLGLVLVSWLAGCASTMSPKQAEGVELRRYCESHLKDQLKCLGFYAFG